jgi:hypothetical protein
MGPKDRCLWGRAARPSALDKAPHCCPPVVEEEMVRATFIDSFDAAIFIASSASGGRRGEMGGRERACR